jgi:hypothetical protein
MLLRRFADGLITPPMPLYFFNVYNDEDTVDEEGQDLPDLDAAREEAIISARALICEGVHDGEVTLSHRIEVLDQSRRPALTVTFGDAVRINP